MAINKQFWNGKKVFITGHSGFKGSWLTSWLVSLGASVVGYSLPPRTIPNMFNIAQVNDDINSIDGDILDQHKLLEALKQQKPEIVFHLAAQSLVHYSYQNPVETFSVNVIGTVNLLEAIRSVSSVKAVVMVTSDKCYENQEWLWGYRENDPMGGYDPYSSSKGCAELVVSAYRRSYFNSSCYEQHGVALATARAGNVIGGGDWALNRLIPDLIRSFSNNEAAIIRNPNSFRPWQHVLDPLQGYLMLAEQLCNSGVAFAEAWNFGPHEEDVKPVSWVADQLIQLWGENAKWQVEKQSLLHEAKNLKLDCNKSRTLLKWDPKMSIITTLKYTCDWYKAYYHQQDMAVFTKQQIKKYESEECSK